MERRFTDQERRIIAEDRDMSIAFSSEVAALMIQIKKMAEEFGLDYASDLIEILRRLDQEEYDIDLADAVEEERED